MKSSRLSQSLIPALAALAVLTSFGVVALQMARRDSLKNKLDASEREIARLEKRYKELRPASSGSALSASSPERRHAHHHHDGDGE